MRLIDKCKVLELFEGFDVTGWVQEGTELKDLRDKYWTADTEDIITYIDGIDLHYMIAKSKILRNETTNHILCMAFEEDAVCLAIFDCALFVENVFDVF